MASPIEERPELAAAIGRVTGAWAHLEYTMTLIFCHLSGMDIHSAACVFGMFRTTQTQSRALSELAKVSTLISPEIGLELRESMKELERLARTRNEIMHNPLGWASRDTGEIYLMTRVKGDSRRMNIPYQTRPLDIREIDILNADIVRLVERLWSLEKSMQPETFLSTLTNYRQSTLT